MDDSQPTDAPVVHPPMEQQASEPPVVGYLAATAQPTTPPQDTESNLVSHARRELTLRSEDPWMVQGLLRVVQAFADMGHSGSSAPHAAAYLEALLNYRTLTPLTDDPAEWIDRAAEGMASYPCWQSARDSQAFSEDGGRTYWLLSEREAAGSMETTPVHTSEQLPPSMRAAPIDWSGHVPAETPVDTSSALIAASEAEGWAQRQTPTVTPADAVSILRAHADYIDPDGRSVPPADALTAATLRMAAQFLEDVAPEPLPRRQRLHPALLRQLLLKAEAQQGALGPVDVQFVPAAGYTEQPPPGDACEVLEVDGESVRIHGQGDLTAEAAAAVGAVVRIGREQLAEAWPDGDMP